MHGRSWKKKVESEAASKRRREMTAFFNANENDALEREIWCCREEKRMLQVQCS